MIPDCGLEGPHPSNRGALSALRTHRRWTQVPLRQLISVTNFGLLVIIAPWQNRPRTAQPLCYSWASELWWSSLSRNGFPTGWWAGGGKRLFSVAREKWVAAWRQDPRRYSSWAKGLLASGETIARKRRSHPRHIISPRAGLKRGSGTIRSLFSSADCRRGVRRLVWIGVRPRRPASALETPQRGFDFGCTFIQVWCMGGRVVPCRPPPPGGTKDPITRSASSPAQDEGRETKWLSPRRWNEQPAGLSFHSELTIRWNQFL